MGRIKNNLLRANIAELPNDEARDIIDASALDSIDEFDDE